jgi:hypothetical protein
MVGAGLELLWCALSVEAELMPGKELGKLAVLR